MDQLSAAATVTQRHVGTCVEIKLQHATDAMLSPQLRLLDGVGILRHRRDVGPVTA